MTTTENEPRPWFRELKKFVGQEVMVVTEDGSVYKGRCVAILFGLAGVVLMSAEEKIIVRSVRSVRVISRKLTFGAGHKEGTNAA
jgi:small nuclear ribonucleoprotein (snRNP)-like protein